MQFIKLAWRNILRNPRRTALTLSAFSLGVAALVFAWSVFDGSNAQMIGNMTGNYTGYIQVHARGYTDDPSVDRAFDAGDIAALRANEIPGVVAASTRMDTMALVSSTDNSRGLILTGVDPTMEPKVTALGGKMTAGRYFRPGDRGGILIGKALGKVLGVGIGDEVAVLTQGMQGSIGAQRYRVQGLYDTQNDMVDGLQAFITRDDAGELLSSAGKMTTVALKLNDRDMTDDIVQEIRLRLGNRFEVEGWRQLLPEVAQSVDFHESVGRVVTMLLFGIVAIGVANTVLMSVMERLREFGVMLALGTAPLHVFRLIICEGLLIGLIGFAIGLAIGYGVVAHFGSTGIEFTQQAQAIQSMKGVTRTIYPHLGVARMLYISTAVLIVIIAASLYPAWKVARLLPLRAMRGLAGEAADVPVPIAADVQPADRFLLLTLALRNLSRHAARSWLTLLAVAFGLGLFVFMSSIANGFYTQIVENATGMVSGDAQIQHKDFKNDMKPTLTLDGGMRLLEQVRKLPSVAGATSRVQTTAMITSATKSLPIMLIGADPVTEPEVTILHKSVKEGSYLLPGHNREIVIGRKLAELLHVGIGEKVVVMAQDVHGDLASEAFLVSGMFYTGSHSFDDVIAHVTLPAIQKMLAMDGGITNIVLRMKDRDENPAAALEQVRALVPPGDMRLLRWQELVPEAAQMNTIFKRSLSILLAIVLTMVSVVIVNTILMSVMERTREFGMMLALGSRPGQIVRLVQLESLILGLLGTVAGLGLGVLLTLMHVNGVNMKTHGAAIPGVTNVIYPELSGLALAVPGVLLPLLALLAAFYPALRASRLDPVQAIRHG